MCPKGWSAEHLRLVAGADTAAGKDGRDEEPMIGPKPASAAERKAQAAAEAKERSDRILEEESAKDRAWRRAVLMVRSVHSHSTALAQ